MTSLSHAIESVERFATPDGKEFDSPERALQHLENRAEAFIRQAWPVVDSLSAGDRIKLTQWILDNRKALCGVLNF